jgi:hypothetical protein
MDKTFFHESIILNLPLNVPQEDANMMLLKLAIAVIFTLVSGTVGYFYAILAGGSTFWFSIPPVSWILGALICALIFLICAWMEKLDRWEDPSNERWFCTVLLLALMFPVACFQVAQALSVPGLSYGGYVADGVLIAMLLMRLDMGLPIPPPRVSDM